MKPEAPPRARAARAELISIGSELLLGETVDTNAAYLAAELAAIGLPPAAGRTLPDDRPVIRDAFADALARCDLVLATGGLGPTHDDLTREGLADALGEELVLDPDLVIALERRFRSYGRMPASNRRQAMLVPSASAVPNPIGSAPGWWAERDGRVIVLLPGVPAEMRRMWTEQIRPRLRERFGQAQLATRTVKSFGVGESTVAERLAALLERPPSGVDAGIYARDDGVHVRFSTAGDPSGLEPCVAEALRLMGEDAYGTDDDDLATAALRRLGHLGAETVASAELDTGGALLAVLSAAVATAAMDGSARFVGGVLDMGGGVGAPAADAVVRARLLPEDSQGRSRVRVAVDGRVRMPEAEVRVHGSGPQRLRRAAFATLDLVRRAGDP